MILSCLCSSGGSPDRVFCVGNYGVIDVSFPRDAISIRLVDGPEGMQLIEAAGLLLWSPATSQVGVHHATVEARMPDGQVRREEYDLRATHLQKALFVFAHQDDEFGILARMIQLKEQGVDVTAVWTLGNKRRVAESAKAMDLIGVPKDRLHTLSCGGLANAASVKKTVDSLAQLMRTNQFEEIYVNAFEGGHFQHDLTQFAVVQAAQAAGFTGQIYEFPLYNFDGWVNLFRLVPATVPTIQMSLARERMKFIQSLTTCYPSQALTTLGFTVAMPTRHKMHPTFRPLPAWDYTRPPHPGCVWHDINLRQRISGSRSYRDAVLNVVREYYNLSGVHPSTALVHEQDKTREARKQAAKALPAN